MNSGTLTLNGMTDRELIKVLEAKAKNEQLIDFNPQLAQPVNQMAPPGQRPLQHYNNVEVNWRSEEGGKIILELLRRLVEEPEPAPAK